MTLVPDIPLIIGWPMADPKSAEETPSKSSIASPKLEFAAVSISSPSTTCNAPFTSEETNEAVTTISSVSCAVIFNTESAPITKNA